MEENRLVDLCGCLRPVGGPGDEDYDARSTHIDGHAQTKTWLAWRRTMSRRTRLSRESPRAGRRSPTTRLPTK